MVAVQKCAPEASSRACLTLHAARAAQTWRSAHPGIKVEPEADVQESSTMGPRSGQLPRAKRHALRPRIDKARSPPH
eukprot:308099-Alexandrium_andersonii.AAC.1